MSRNYCSQVSERTFVRKKSKKKTSSKESPAILLNYDNLIVDHVKTLSDFSDQKNVAKII